MNENHFLAFTSFLQYQWNEYFSEDQPTNPKKQIYENYTKPVIQFKQDIKDYKVGSCLFLNCLQSCIYLHSEKDVANLKVTSSLFTNCTSEEKGGAIHILFQSGSNCFLDKICSDGCASNQDGQLVYSESLSSSFANNNFLKSSSIINVPEQTDADSTIYFNSLGGEISHTNISNNHVSKCFFGTFLGKNQISLCSIYNNTAEYGCCAFTLGQEGSPSTIIYSNFMDNIIRNKTSVFILTVDSTLSVQNCNFLNNIGDQLFLFLANGNKIITVKDCYFEGNNPSETGSVIITGNQTSENPNNLILSTCPLVDDFIDSITYKPTPVVGRDSKSDIN